MSYFKCGHVGCLEAIKSGELLTFRQADIAPEVVAEVSRFPPCFGFFHPLSYVRHDFHFSVLLDEIGASRTVLMTDVSPMIVAALRPISPNWVSNATVGRCREPQEIWQSIQRPIGCFPRHVQNAGVTIETMRRREDNRLKQWAFTLIVMTNVERDELTTEGLLTATLEGLNEGLAIYGPDEKLVLCNQEFRRQLGLISDLLVPGASWRDILQACIDNQLAIGIRDILGDLDAQCDALRQVTERRTSVHELNGRYFDLSFNPMSNGGFFITRVDVTERVEAEKRAKERDELIRLVVESCPVPIMMNRADTGEILFISPQAKALYGHQTTSRDYYVSLEDRDRFIGEVRRHREVYEYRLRLRNASGKHFWSAVSARLIHWGGEDVIVSHSRDLTNQLAIEEQLTRQREKVFQSEKMSALGGLLAGVAHELNNPLSVVVGHAMMLSDESQDPEVLRQTKKIRDAAERCAKIVRTFLTMARQDPTRMEPVNVADIVETAIDVARYGNPSKTVKMLVNADDDLPQIYADQDQITQTVVNLVINAQQAIEDAGVGDCIRIVAQRDAQKSQVRLTVEDNGPGIPSEIRARVFDPFFTTKGVGRGTGIGLAVCDRIVAAHRGKIEVEDRSPTGTCFTITLPIGSLPADQPKVGKMIEKPRSIRVLVIDDEADVADLNVEVLQRGGYDAKALYQADKALETLRAERYDVVLSDLNMPRLDGRGVFEAISREFPELISRTGFVTGDTMGRASQTFL
ncbi:MAG: ATP-binding protein, partial [Pseudomonadota bacterium]